MRGSNAPRAWSLWLSSSARAASSQGRAPGLEIQRFHDPAVAALFR